MAFTGKIYFLILGLGLGSVALVLHVSGLGHDTSGLVNIPGVFLTKPNLFVFVNQLHVK